jgi:site-specific recombinase XerC
MVPSQSWCKKPVDGQSGTAPRPPVGTLLDLFEAFHVHEKQHSARTARLYRWRIEHLCHLDGRYRRRDNLKVTSPEPPPLHPFAATSRNLRIPARPLWERRHERVGEEGVRLLLRWAVEEGYTEENPANALKRPKLAETEYKALSDENAKKLAKTAFNSGAADDALVRVFLHSGLRLSEAANPAWRPPRPAEDPQRLCSG